jgi:redox-sensing transcriptional repressor
MNASENDQDASDAERSPLDANELANLKTAGENRAVASGHEQGPKPADPKATDQKPSDPKATDPKATDPKALPGKSTGEARISSASVSRMALYLRELRQLEQRGVETVQSRLLGSQLGLSDSQIRRDLSVFNLSGRRGVGYSVANLIASIRSIMGTDRAWDVILVGMGNLGRALSGYRGFGEQSFRLIAVFDIDPAKISTDIGGLTVQPLEDIAAVVKESKVGLAILAVPAIAAQNVADRLAEAGICGILNFASITVRPQTGAVAVVDVDLALELQRLAFAVVNQTDKS